MTPLILLITLAFLVSVDLRILAPVLPSISASRGSTPGTVGLAMTSYALAYGTGQLVYGPLSDRPSRIAVVRAAGLGFSVCTVLSALAVTTWQFIGTRLLAGTFAGAVIPLTLVFVGDTVEFRILRNHAVRPQPVRRRPPHRPLRRGDHGGRPADGAHPPPGLRQRAGRDRGRADGRRLPGPHPALSPRWLAG